MLANIQSHLTLKQVKIQTNMIVITFLEMIKLRNTELTELKNMPMKAQLVSLWGGGFDLNAWCHYPVCTFPNFQLNK